MVFAPRQSSPRGTPPKFGWNRGGVALLSSNISCNISKTGQDMTKVTVDNQWQVTYALSIGAKINDLG